MRYSISNTPFLGQDLTAYRFMDNSCFSLYHPENMLSIKFPPSSESGFWFYTDGDTVTSFISLETVTLRVNSSAALTAALLRRAAAKPVHWCAVLSG